MSIIEIISDILKGSLIIVITFVTVGSLIEYFRGNKPVEELKEDDDKEEWEDTHNEGSWD